MPVKLYVIAWFQSPLVGIRPIAGPIAVTLKISRSHAEQRLRLLACSVSRDSSHTYCHCQLIYIYICMHIHILLFKNIHWCPWSGYCFQFVQGMKPRGMKVLHENSFISMFCTPLIILVFHICKFFRLIRVVWTCIAIVWICRSIYRWVDPAHTSAFFSLSKARSGWKRSRRERQRDI